jgi:MFS family permease
MHLPKILRYPNFSRLFYAGSTSELGSFITETALMLTVFNLSGQDKSFLGLARAVFLFFLTIGNLTGGAIGERFNRKSVLIFTKYARIPIVASLFFIDQIYWVIFVDGLIALFTGIYNPTRQALVNDIVPQDDISKANALFGSTFAVLHMLGPLLGAFLYAHFAGINQVLAFDLLTYFIGIYLISKISYKTPKKEVSQETASNSSFYKEITEGISIVFKRKDLFAIITNALTAGFCIGFLIPLLLPYFKEVLGMGEKAYGIAFSFFGLGGLIGGYVSQKLTEKYSIGKLIIWSLCFEPIMMFVWLKFPGFYNTCIIFLLWGLVVLVRMTSQLNYISNKVETKYLTRVFSLIDLAFVFPNIASGIIVSFIGDSLSTNEILSYVSVFFILLVFPRLPFKDMLMLYNSNDDKINRDTSIQDQIS